MITVPSRSVGAAAAILAITLLATIGALDSTTSFRVCLGTLLSFLACAELYVAATLFVNRHNSLLELSQPIALSIFAIAASIATVGTFTFAIPESNAACALRQPITFTSISFMGSILVSRAWRISCVVSPTTDFASATSSNEKLADKIEVSRSRLMFLLTKISEYSKMVLSCGKYRVQSTGRLKTLVRRVSPADSMRVALVLVIPQIILQIINLSLPSVRMQSVEVSDDIYDCRSNSGPLLLIIGLVICTLPFFVALLLNIQSAGLPGIFREFDQIVFSMGISFCILSITMPAVGLTSRLPGSTNACAYLMAAAVLGFVLPLCYNVSSFWMKVCSAKKGKANNKQTERYLRRSSSLDVGNRTQIDDLQTLQMAEDSTTMSKMLLTMGRWEKALEINNDVLSLFKADGEGEYCWEDGFTDSERDSFGPKTLQIAVSTLIGSSKMCVQNATCRGETNKTLLTKGRKSLFEGLDIFDKAQVKGSLKDRSFVFPGFSFLSVLIASGDMEPPDGQSPAEFENSVASSFVQETRHQLFHHCRSLALKADALAKYQDFKGALSVVDDINQIYNAELHSTSISNEYATDHTARIVSQSAMWLYHLKDKKKSLARCVNEVITQILPNMEGNDVLGLLLVLLPVIRVLKAEGQAGKAHKLFKDYVVSASKNNKGSPALMMIKPVLILLRCLDSGSDPNIQSMKYEGMEEDVTWVLNGEEKISDWNDSMYRSRTDWSPFSLLAEVCLLLAKRVSKGHDQEKALIMEGLRLCTLTDKKLKDEDGIVVAPVAYSSHIAVYSELQALDHPV